MSRYIFVYGTLKRGFENPIQESFTRMTEFLGEGEVVGSLYQIDGYPGAVPEAGSGRRIKGEVFIILDEGILVKMDEYEEITDAYPAPHEYRRELVDVFGAFGTRNVRAWIYWFNHSHSEFERIPSGRFE